jgi:hypothetical protein
VPCGTTGATCSKTTTLKVGGGGNQEVVSLTKDAPLPDISKLKRLVHNGFMKILNYLQYKLL